MPLNRTLWSVAHACARAQSLFPIWLCGLTDCILPVSSVHGISQTRILEWVAISFSRGSSQLRDQTCVSCIGRWILYHWATWEAHRHRQIIGKLRKVHCGFDYILGVTLHLLCTLVTHSKTSLPAKQGPWQLASRCWVSVLFLAFELRGVLYWLSSNIWWQVTNNDPRHIFH